MSEPLLAIDDLRVHLFTNRGVVRAVDGVGFALSSGESLGIVGESGCGKTMTALSLMRLIPSPPARIVSGRIMFDGEDVVTLDELRLRGVLGAGVTTPLLQVHELTKHFPITGGPAGIRIIGQVRAVDGVSFKPHRGRDAGARRRIRLRQVDYRPHAVAPHRNRPPAASRSAAMTCSASAALRSAGGGGRCRSCSRTRMPRSVRASVSRTSLPNRSTCTGYAHLTASGAIA